MLPLVLKDFGGRAPRLGSHALDFATDYFWLWIFIMLPFYFIFVGILNYYSEHSHSLWKHINAQPVSGTVQALAKHFCAWCCVAAATTMLSLLILITLLMVKLTHPALDVGLSSGTLWIALFKLNLGTIVGGMTVVSILNTLSARFSGFSVTVMTGFFGVLVAIFIKSDDPAAPFVPWMIEKVCIRHIAFTNDPYNPLWAIAPVLWIAAAVAAHIAMQRKRPLY
jgi:hypothetical protein